MSSLQKIIDANYIPKGFWIAGDDAYGCTDFVICPYKRSSETKYTDSFNFYQSSHRVHVEQAFEQWVAKFRILKKEMSHQLPNITSIITATAYLHNFCIDHDCGAGDDDDNNEPMYNSDFDTVRPPDFDETPTEKLTLEFHRLRQWLGSTSQLTDLVSAITYDGTTIPSLYGSSAAFYKSTIRANLLWILWKTGQLRPLYARREGPRETSPSDGLFGGQVVNEAETTVTDGDIESAVQRYDEDDEFTVFVEELPAVTPIVPLNNNGLNVGNGTGRSVRV